MAVAGAGPSPGRHYPQTVDYCGVCTMPTEVSVVYSPIELVSWSAREMFKAVEKKYIFAALSS